MARTTLRGWLIVVAALAVASAASLALLASGAVVASALRDPLLIFVQPGATIWWFALGNLFGYVPTSAADIAFAAAANTALWSLVLWAGARTVRALHRGPGAPRS